MQRLAIRASRRRDQNHQIPSDVLDVNHDAEIGFKNRRNIVGHAVHMYDTFREVRKINTVKQSHNTPFSFKFVASILVPVAARVHDLCAMQ
jgi:hypothetical protein